MFATDVDIDNLLKREDVNLLDFYLRFENVVNDFKNHDKIVAILNEEQLGFLRKIVLDVTNKIEDLFDKIMDRNRAESTILISKLRKPQQEEKSYEDMSKEELIERVRMLEDIKKSLVYLTSQQPNKNTK